MIQSVLGSKLVHMTLPNRFIKMFIDLVSWNVLWQRGIMVISNLSFSSLSFVKCFGPLESSSLVFGPLNYFLFYPSRRFSSPTLSQSSIFLYELQKMSRKSATDPAMVIGEHSSTSLKYSKAKNLQRLSAMFWCLWKLFSNGCGGCRTPHPPRSFSGYRRMLHNARKICSSPFCLSNVDIALQDLNMEHNYQVVRALLAFHL